jgi:hypothetical protein
LTNGSGFSVAPAKRTFARHISALMFSRKNQDPREAVNFLKNEGTLYVVALGISLVTLSICVSVLV